MVRRSLFLAFVLGFAALLVGCGKPWNVVHQASPNPMFGQRQFAVMPIEYTGLTVGEKTEASYLAGKDEEQRASFAGDKAGINEEFANALTEMAASEGIQVVLSTGPGSAPFHVRPHISFIEPGFYAFVASKPSEVHMTVRITAPDGRIYDEITIVHNTDSKSGFSIGGVSTNPSSGGRLRKDGEGLGAIVAKYLKERVAGD